LAEDGVIPASDYASLVSHYLINLISLSMKARALQSNQTQHAGALQHIDPYGLID
jgi:hypothetical protein